MRAVIQRVSQAHVDVGDRTVGRIGAGLVILIGVGQGDAATDADLLAEKTAQLRIFPDEQGKMNRSLLDVAGGALVISQFTLLGDCRKGRRPAFTAAAEPGLAKTLYEHYCRKLAEQGVNVQQGVFAADMQVHLINTGPVTMLLDSRKAF